jgi:lysophospholipase L1-like esterase
VIANPGFGELGKASNPLAPFDADPAAKHVVSHWKLVAAKPSTLAGRPYPRAGSAGQTECVPAERGSQPFLSLDVPAGSEAFAEQVIKIPAQPSRLRLKTWGNNQPVDARVSLVTADGVERLRIFFQPPLLGPTPARECLDASGPRQLSLDVSSFAGQTVGLRLAATSQGDNGTIANFDNLSLRAQEPAATGIDYVALGDSYSSGEGNAPYEPASATDDDKCHRSQLDAYSKQLRLPRVTISTLHFFACSGATSADVLDTEFRTEPPQLSHIAELAAADLLTISVGGNDAGFSKALEQCVARICSRKPFSTRIIKRIAGLVPLLVETYARLRAAAPQATIVVLDYPNAFPKLGFGGSFRCRSNAAALLGRKGVNFLHERSDQLDDVIADAVRRANEEGSNIRLVGVRGVFAGHDVCEKDRWVRALKVSGPSKQNQAVVIDTGSFHPNEAGQRAYAEALARELEGVF